MKYNFIILNIENTKYKIQNKNINICLEYGRYSLPNPWQGGPQSYCRNRYSFILHLSFHLTFIHSFIHSSFLSFIYSLILPSPIHFYVYQSFHPFKHLPILYSVYHSNPKMCLSNMLSCKTLHQHFTNYTKYKCCKTPKSTFSVKSMHKELKLKSSNPHIFAT